MAEKLAYLEAVIGADITQFRKGMRDIRNETGILSETMRGVAGFGRTLTFAYTTPLLVLGTTALQTATEFEAAMYNINSIAGLSTDQLAALSAQTLEFGKTTRSGAIASAEALYTVFSAGIMDTTDAFTLMNQAVKTSEAGLANLDSTTNGMIAVMLSYGDTSAEMAQRTSDTITRMVQVGVGSMDAFVSSIGGLVPAAAAVGMEMEEWGADMAFLTQRGLSAAQAGISMNAILKKLISPTEAMNAAFSELGHDNLPDLIEEFGSVNEVIEALIQNADGDLSQLYAMFNTTQGQRGIAQFVAGYEAWQTAQDDFNSAVGGATQRAWEEQMKSFAASWDLLKSAIQGAGIAIGQSMFPVLEPLVDMLTGFINQISSANPEIIGMSVAFIAVSAAIPPLLWLLGSLLSPIGLIIGGIAALAVAFETNFGGIKDTVMDAVGGILAELDPLITAMEDFWTDFFGTGGDESNGETFFNQKPVPVDVFDYITVTEPMSLWEVYEEYGYADQFSWQEFMDAAFAGGWSGEAVTPDTPIRINPTFEFGSGIAANSEDAGIRQLADTVAPENLFGNAIEDAMLSVDMMRIQNAVTDIFSKISDWIMNTAVPTTAQAMGWAGGTIAQLLFSGIVSGISYVFSGQAASDTSGILTGIKTFLSSHVVAPFTDGINQAIEGTQLQTALDTVTGFIDGVKDHFQIEEGIDLSGFNDLVDGIKSAFDSLASADWSGVAKLGVIIGVIAGGTFGVAMDILGGLASGLGLVIAGLGSGLAAIVDALALAGNGDLEGGLAKLGQGLIDFGIALLQIPVGIIDAIAQAVTNLFGVDIGTLGEWLSGVQAEIDASIDEWINGRDTDIINAGEFFKWEFNDDNVPAIMENMDALVGMMGAELQRDWAGSLPEDLVIPANFEITPNTVMSLQWLNDIATDSTETEAARLMATRIREEFIAEMMEAGIEIPPEAFTLSDGETIVTGWELVMDSPVITATGTPTVNTDNLLPPQTGTAGTLEIDWTGGMTLGGDTGAAVPMDSVTVAPSVLNLEPVAMAFGERMLSGEDAQAIIDTSFVPISDAWVAMFAPDGTMALTFGVFNTGVITGWTDMGTAVNGYFDNLDIQLPEATTALTNASNSWIAALMPFGNKVISITAAVKTLTTAIKDLMKIQAEFSITVDVSGNLLDGSHADGLNRVPYDGYVAELHQDEMVLTKEQARDYRSGGSYSAADVMPNGGYTGSSETHNVININGVQDVDRILGELNRRGIKIGK